MNGSDWLLCSNRTYTNVRSPVVGLLCESFTEKSRSENFSRKSGSIRYLSQSEAYSDPTQPGRRRTAGSRSSCARWVSEKVRTERSCYVVLVVVPLRMHFTAFIERRRKVYEVVFYFRLLAFDTATEPWYFQLVATTISLRLVNDAIPPPTHCKLFHCAVHQCPQYFRAFCILLILGRSRLPSDKVH